MPEFKDLIAGKWQSWWAFQFCIAQPFQIMSIFGHASFENFSATGAQGKIVSAMAIIATIAFFLFPLFYFLTGCKMSQKISLVVGYCAFLVQMVIMSQDSWNQTQFWQFWVGWVGLGNALLATVFLFLDKSGEKKPDMGISSFTVCSAFAFSLIANCGFSVWSIRWTMEIEKGSAKYSAALILDILGAVFAGFGVLSSFYNFAKGKWLGSGLAALCMFGGAFIHSSGFVFSNAALANAHLFRWLAAIASIASVVLIEIMKK